MTSNLILKWTFKSQNSVMETNTIMYNKICISPYIAFSKKNQYDIITFSISYELCTHFFVKWLFTPLSPKINSIMSNEPVLERYLLMFILSVFGYKMWKSPFYHPIELISEIHSYWNGNRVLSCSRLFMGQVELYPWLGWVDSAIHQPYF